MLSLSLSTDREKPETSSERRQLEEKILQKMVSKEEKMENMINSDMLGIKLK